MIPVCHRKFWGGTGGSKNHTHRWPAARVSPTLDHGSFYIVRKVGTREGFWAASLRKVEEMELSAMQSCIIENHHKPMWYAGVEACHSFRTWYMHWLQVSDRRNDIKTFASSYMYLLQLQRCTCLYVSIFLTPAVLVINDQMRYSVGVNILPQSSFVEHRLWRRKVSHAFAWLRRKRRAGEKSL